LDIENRNNGEKEFPWPDTGTNNLIEIIRALYPGNDFNKRHVYDINIEFKGGEIWINGWRLVDLFEELTPWKY
jgi:hypothetical protein